MCLTHPLLGLGLGLEPALALVPWQGLREPPGQMGPISQTCRTPFFCHKLQWLENQVTPDESWGLPTKENVGMWVPLLHMSRHMHM